jgi:hypothetical protein
MWAIIALGIALSADVEPDARWIVLPLSVLGPAAAATAGGLVLRGQDVWAGMALVASAATPTYFAWPFSAVAFAAGLTLMIAGRNDVRAGRS